MAVYKATVQRSYEVEIYVEAPDSQTAQEKTLEAVNEEKLSLQHRSMDDSTQVFCGEADRLDGTDDAPDAGEIDLRAGDN